MAGTVEKHSPRGLIRVRSRSFRLKPPKTLKLTAKFVARNLAAVRKVASAAIVTEKKDPSEQADRAYFAKCMLQNLVDLDRFWHELGRDNPAVLYMVQAALALSRDYHLLTVVENELEISAAKKMLPALQETRQAANATRHADRAREWAKWNRAAQPIWGRSPKLSAQAVARQIREKLRLAEDERTIAKRLKKPGTAG